MTTDRRYCAADIGSNSIKMRIVEAANGKRRTLAEARYPIRLGESAFSTGEIDQAAIEATASAFEEIAATCRSYQVSLTRAVATSATREASNRDAFVAEIKRRSGISVEIIRGAEEARLVAAGVRPDMRRRLPNLILDVGGGSTECIYVRRNDTVSFARSLRLGAVRLQQMFSFGTRISIREYDTLMAAVTDTLEQAQLPVISPDTHVIGLAGTIRALLDVKHGGQTQSDTALSTDDLNRVLSDLQGLTAEEMGEKFNVDSKRAEIIIQGGVIVAGILGLYGLKGISVSSRGLRDGLIEDLVCSDQQVAYSQARESALAVGEKYGFEEAHGLQVGNIATQLFDELATLHHLDEQWREPLLVGALLHDIGQFISYSGHHKHSHYLILNEDLPGLTAEQQQVAAAIARYHRKSAPLERHPEYATLSGISKEAVQKCAAILRIADALDRQHRGLVSSVSVKLDNNQVSLKIRASGPVLLELSASNRKGQLFESLFSRKLNVIAESSGNGTAE